MVVLEGEKQDFFRNFLFKNMDCAGNEELAATVRLSYLNHLPGGVVEA